MGKALLMMLALVLLVYALFDLRATPREKVAYLSRLGWFFVIVLIPWVGPALWLFLGHHHHDHAPRQTAGRGPIGPDDDPDYLRHL